MNNIITIPIKVGLTNEIALEFMDLIEWTDVPEDFIAPLSKEVREQAFLLMNNFSDSYERFTTSNGMTMIRCYPLHWQVQGENFDGSGEEVFQISFGGMADRVYCRYEPEEKILSIDGFELDCKTFEAAGKQVLRYVKRNNIRDFEGTIYVDQ